MSVVKIWCEGEDCLNVTIDSKLVANLCDDVDNSEDYFLHFSDGTVVKVNYNEEQEFPFWEVGVVKNGYATAFHEAVPSFDKAPSDFESMDEFGEAKGNWYEDHASEICILNFPHDIDDPVLTMFEEVDGSNACSWLDDWFDNHGISELTNEQIIAVFKAVSGYKG